MNKKIKKRWEQHEIVYLMDNWRKYTDEYLAEQLGRTAQSVTSARFRLGLTFYDAPYQPYTERIRKKRKRDALIIRYFGLKPDAELAAMTGYTLSSLRCKASMLGLHRHVNRTYRWTPDNIEYLKSNYNILSNEDIAAHIGTSANAIYQKACVLGLLNENSKDARPCVSTEKRPCVSTE